MCYPVCGMVYIKEPLLLISNSSSTPYSDARRFHLWYYPVLSVKSSNSVLSSTKCEKF